MSRLLAITSGARVRRAAGPCHRTLLDDIRRVHCDNHGCYGSPRIHLAPEAQGRGTSRGRIERSLRRLGIRAIMARPWGADHRLWSRLADRSQPAQSAFTAELPNGSDSPTSPTSKPGRAGSICPPSWTSIAAGSSARRCGIICALNCHLPHANGHLGAAASRRLDPPFQLRRAICLA
ncbi:IS3 family transposase [Bradyrhizobium sp. CCBAU 21362]|uniref:IS3 family transposase n=1 Tax=Bradyrhizobium sp. CCBAU 21362 TaxID=1325082 RepID=UPI003FA43AEB